MSDNLTCYAVIAHSVHKASKIQIIYIELYDLITCELSKMFM